MGNILCVRGRVIDAPVFCFEHTEFSVLTAEQKLTVIRLDPKWQKRDIVFLYPGQLVEIYGEFCNDLIAAERIVITDDPDRTYIEDKER